MTGDAFWKAWPGGSSLGCGDTGPGFAWLTKEMTTAYAREAASETRKILRR